MVFSQTFPFRVTTTKTSKPTVPQIKLENPLDAETFVTQIQIIPDFVFAESAKIVVKINDVTVFDNTALDNFWRDVGLYSIPLSRNKLNRAESVKVFVFNGDNSNEINADINISISSINIAPNQTSFPIGRDDKIRAVTDQARLTSPDGGTGIVATAYTCPPARKARVIIFETRFTVSGSAGLTRILLRGQRMATWENDTKNPAGLAVNASNTYWKLHDGQASGEARKIWSEGSFPQWNRIYHDFAGEELSAGETIAYDGTFSTTFNATVDYAYSILETKA